MLNITLVAYRPVQLRHYVFQPVEVIPIPLYSSSHTSAVSTNLKGWNPAKFDSITGTLPIYHALPNVWLGSLTVTCRTCNPEVTQRRRFDSAPRHCRVTTLGKLFTHVPLSPSSIIWYRLHCWDVNRRTVQCTSPIFVVSQCKNWCLAEGLRKRRSALPYGP